MNAKREMGMNGLRRKAEAAAGELAEMGRVIRTLDAAVAESQRLIRALIDVVGVEDVKQMYAENRRQDLAEETDKNDQDTKTGIADGYISVEEEVSEDSIFVVSEAAKDGSSIPRRYLSAAQLVQVMNPTAAAELLSGKGKGYEFQTPNGTKATVLEIYRIDQERLLAYQEKKAEEAAAARKAAEEAAAAAQGDGKESSAS